MVEGLTNPVVDDVENGRSIACLDFAEEREDRPRRHGMKEA
jgi:hypothetical protein